MLSYLGKFPHRENFRDKCKIMKNAKFTPTRKFPHLQYQVLSNIVGLNYIFTKAFKAEFKFCKKRNKYITFNSFVIRVIRRERRSPGSNNQLIEAMVKVFQK